MADVLMIGATSAIASALARAHAARGDRLALLARNAEALAALTTSLGDAVVHSAAFDFTDVTEIKPALDAALQALGGLDVAVIAHGWLGSQLQSEHDAEHAAQVIETNLTSAIRFIVPLANCLEQQQKGTLLVLSSVAGDRGRPRNYTYGAAKGALSLYLQGVRSRLYGKGVRVVNVRLGPVDTPMTTDHKKNALFASAEQVAAALLRAEQRGAEDVYIPGFWAWIMAAVRNLPEPLFQRFSFLSGR